MDFKIFVELLQNHFEDMVREDKTLYSTDTTGDELWETYLNSFPTGTNEVFRVRREYDCSACKQFIRDIGNAVVIKHNKVISIWDVETEDAMWKHVASVMSNFVKSRKITNYYIAKGRNIGTETSFENKEGKITTWNHFFISAEKNEIKIMKESDIPSFVGKLRESRSVFKRALDELSIDAVESIIELISQGSVYRGDEHISVLKNFLSIQKAYSLLSDEEKELYTWAVVPHTHISLLHIRNTSIGTLIVDLSEGLNIEDALTKYEKITAPSNYKRPKAIFTQKDVERAKKTVVELGYELSLARRFARLEDITVNDILFANKDASRRIQGDAFDILKVKASPSKKFDRAEEISIEDFINNVLPTTESIELLFDYGLSSNLVSLIAPKNADAKSMFKWGNGFSWAYNGNIADSMKNLVKEHGGKVDGVLRFSIQWNEDDDNENDFDAHCNAPSGHIFYGCPRISDGGNLDIDILNPNNKVAVENITWPSTEKMISGNYRFYVHNFAHRGGRSGFRAEIEFEGKVFSFSYNKDIRQNESVEVAEVIFNKAKNTFTLVEKLPASAGQGKEIWEMTTGSFVPVTVMMTSPNYWTNSKNIGNKHYFFMVKGCINTNKPNGFFNEYLDEALMQHKRVFEALGSQMHVDDDSEQLSGFGFSSTKRDSVTCKVKGATERILKINF